MNSSKWLGIGMVAIVLVVGAYLIGQNSNNQAPSTNAPDANNTGAQSTSTPATQNTNQTANNTTSTQDDAGVVLNTPSDWANAPIAGNVGDHWKKISLGANPITEDSITYSQTINDLGQTILASDPTWGFLTGGINTTGKFVQVNLTMNNNTQSSAAVEIALYYLADQAGRGYQFKETHSSCSVGADSIATPQTLEPGIPCTARILYEVSQQSQSFNLDFDAKNDQYNGNVPYGK